MSKPLTLKRNGGVRGRSAALLAIACLVAVASAPQTPSLEQVLKAGASYVAEYEKRFSAVVSEETYSQRLVGQIARQLPDQRVLKSDLLLMEVPAGGWVTFRDVFEVDGHKVRDRSDRLVDLILKPRAHQPGERPLQYRSSHAHAEHAGPRADVSAG
jgi:hypothetical protein